MKIFTTIIALLLGSVFVFADDASESETWNELAKIAQKGPKPLLAYIQSNKIQPPSIYSKWYVDEQIAPTDSEKAKLEYAKRDFGKAWLIQLEKESGILQKMNHSAERAKKTKTLLDLAEWIGSSPGYGNAWLFYRLQDLVKVPIGHLIADMEFPEAELEKMVNRLVPYRETAIRNVAGINMEAPNVVFKVGTPRKRHSFEKKAWEDDITDEILAPLRTEWNKHLAMVYKKLPRKIQSGPKVASFEMSVDEARQLVPSELRFFIDDYSIAEPTTLNQWDKKYHHRILRGDLGYRISDYKNFFLYRKRTGKIPACEKTNTDNSAYDDIFRDFWESVITGEDQYDARIWTPAAQVYRQVAESVLIDDDAQISIQSKLKKEAVEKRNEEQTKRAEKRKVLKAQMEIVRQRMRENDKKYNAANFARDKKIDSPAEKEKLQKEFEKVQEERNMIEQEEKKLLEEYKKVL